MTNSCNFDTTVGGDGSTVTDDGAPTTGLAAGYHRIHFVPALSQIVAIALWVKNRALDVVGYVATALGYANAAAASATAAAASATLAASEASAIMSNPAVSGTSVTSMSITVATKTLTTDTGKNFFPGMSLKLFNSVGNYMVGTCTAYNSGTGAMTVVVEQAFGSGTYASWTVGVWVPDLSAETFFWAFILN